ncbi:Cell wall integrity and stress response component 1 [Beauveria bassiana]|uniref:Transmembrane alpha-helix domain-containing protein n=1 Tax=Beauveria bassiana (strain ARSEF 2860) TaxID=655819 RepID=J4KNW1_BEAB2|nr:transmembrane alpha-helix domain-containing protein [Beauveria bassiana ARSEF 2860]EJP66394.1 transmembrane alpha-helix domain-containing protein [Beauveria bassiana ARSEF 2860]KAF1731085.1 Cell wall integrity and stress response component 1 [Beauveria bassiana]KAH8707456.1 Cell wall integrity and stress response component 1 [Beauveria bassiana]
MKSSVTVALPIMAAAGAFANAHSNLHHARVPVPAESGMPRVGVETVQGCFSSVGNMTNENADTKYLSSGSCSTICKGKKLPVAALAPQACYCGYVYPPEDDKLDSAKCDYPCNGFPDDMCGGLKDAYSIYNMGIVLVPGFYSASSSSSSASSTATQGSSSAASTSTAGVTQPPSTETGNSDKSSGSPNVAAIAAGVVVGVVVVAAIIGAVIFFIRRKRNAEIEEEHRRNAAVNAFISGSKPPSTSGGISITDSRLDPVMAHRRLSDGSIADNQDYSRKILRVTNA